MIKNFASIIDENTIKQAEILASQPYIYKHVALMPDAHVGYGASIGTVMATTDVIVPYAVGVDIGCGMRAYNTYVKWDDVKHLDWDKFHRIVSNSIPMGPGKNAVESPQVKKQFIDKLSSWVPPYVKNWVEQLGTLGGGNHFIELCVDEGDNIWLLLHSGSRGAGKQIADFHQKVAIDVCKKKYRSVPSDALAFFVDGEQEFDNYFNDVSWAQVYAFCNRSVMMDILKEKFLYFIDAVFCESLNQVIDCHHNYISMEFHFGKEVFITRKGAIFAGYGFLGIIPGSMGAETYIVEGKGNNDSFSSAPHGAGRVMSRSEAKKNFTGNDLTDQMDGVIWDKDNALIDEIPSCYKPITRVMEDAKDLVEVRHILKQKLNWKGVK